MPTCCGVQVQLQQIPAFSFHCGRWKVSLKNFQSPRTSTKHDFNRKFCDATPDLFESLLSQGCWSCLAAGCLPRNACLMDHETISITSSHVCSLTCDCIKVSKGMRMFLYLPATPSKFKDSALTLGPRKCTDALAGGFAPPNIFFCVGAVGNRQGMEAAF